MKKLAIGLLCLGTALTGCVAYEPPPPARQAQGGDRDRDGVPNRYDRDKDGDGIRNERDRRPNDPTRY